MKNYGPQQLPTEWLCESEQKLLAISNECARTITEIGKSFASRKAWFGDIVGKESRERSVISCTAAEGGYYVSVDNCVGVIATSDIQLIVEPKIHLAHFIHLLQYTRDFPRFGEDPIWLSGSWTIVDLICAWFLNATEALVRRGILSDYVDFRSELAMPRGRIDMLGTAAHYYSGSLYFDCEYDEFDVDIPLNRVICAAARAVRRNAAVSAGLRDRARRVTTRLDGVGLMRDQDLLVTTERRTESYRTPLLLAKAILRSEMRSIEAGERAGWAFLIPTPALIEVAIRTIIETHIPEAGVSNHGIYLSNGEMSVNPDLVFEGHETVGDVKYKHFTEGWARSDLYQSVAFAAAFRVARACAVSFTRREFRVLPDAQFGAITVHHLPWNEDILAPVEAERDFVLRMRAWLLYRGGNFEDREATTSVSKVHEHTE